MDLEDRTKSRMMFFSLFRVAGLVCPGLIGLAEFYIRFGTFFSVQALIFIVIMHWSLVAYLLMRKSRDPRTTQRWLVLVDIYAMGVAIAAMSYSYLFLVLVLNMMIFNSISTDGWRYLVIGTGVFLLGCLSAVPVTGVRFVPYMDTRVSAVLLAYICVHFGVNSFFYFRQVTSMISLKRIIEKSNAALVEKTWELDRERSLLKSRNETIEFELKLAKKIQESLIPAASPAAYIAMRYRPMDEVGGDFFDFIRFGDSGRIGVFLSDVSGHGVPAAFITTMVKTTLLQAGSRAEDPAGLLMYINQVLQDQTAGNFITAFYGIYDPAERSLRYASAGHPGPYLITGQGAAQLKKGKHTALAMFPNALLETSRKSYANFEETLPAGSKLLLYTDGLVEARPVDGDRYFEDEGMVEFFMERRREPCETFLDSVYERLVSFRGGDSFDDDVCIICLDIT